MTQRIIIEYTPPEATQAGIFHMPQNAIAIQYNGKLYIDYLEDGETDLSLLNPFYVGEMLADGSVTDITGDASQFPHVFAGWDRKTPDPVILATLSLTPKQARLALLQEGLLDTINGVVATQPLDVQLVWEFAEVIRRDDPMLCALLEGMGKTAAEVDALFVLGKTL